VGESFLMGQGPAGSATSGQWAAVCALMSAPLPGEGSAAQARACDEVSAALHLQPEAGCLLGGISCVCCCLIDFLPSTCCAVSLCAAVLSSQLVSSPSLQSAGSKGHPSWSGRQSGGSGPQPTQVLAAPLLPGPDRNAQPNLQQLLLNGVATGLVSTGQSVLSLLQ
jgi:hypothetical protein